MRHTDLADLAENVRQKLVCPCCQRHFPAGALDVVDVAGNRGVFAAHCPACNTSTMLTIGIREFKQKIARRHELVEKVNNAKVSPADVVDMKSFLTLFDGDFGSALGEKKPTNEAPETQPEAQNDTTK